MKKIVLVVALVASLIANVFGKSTEKQLSVPLFYEREKTSGKSGQLTNDKAAEEIRKGLIGIWHAAPMIGAGCSDRFYFYPDGKFELLYSDYNEENSLLAFLHQVLHQVIAL